MKNIVGIGSIAFDSVKTPAGVKDRILGGSLTHFINAACVLGGLEIGIVGVVGQDFGPEEESFFKSKNVDLTDLQKKEGKTFFWEGFYQDDMNQAYTNVTELNVFADFSPKISSGNQKTDFLFLGNIDPVLQLEVLSKVKFEHCFMDTMNLWLEIKIKEVKDVLKKVSGLIINEGEAFILSGEANYIKGAKKILAMGPQYLIIKRGSYGVSFFSKNGDFISFPAFPIEDVVDPTGAGDSFAGGFVSYLSFLYKKNGKLDSQSIKEALIYATVVASFNVEGFGVEGLARQSKEQVFARIRQLVQYSSLPIFS